MIATQVSIHDIVESYPQLFILLDSCRFDEGGRVTHGRVLETSHDSDLVYERLRETPNSVIIFSGPGADEYEGAFLDSGQAWEAAVT